MKRAFPNAPMPKQILDLKAEQKEQLRKPIYLRRSE